MFNALFVFFVVLSPVIGKSAGIVDFSWIQVLTLTAIGLVFFAGRIVDFTKQVDKIIESDYANKTGIRKAG